MKLYLSSFLRPSSVLLLTLICFFPWADSLGQCPNLIWSPVTELPQASFNINSDPVGCLDRDNKIELFVLSSDGSIWHTAQKEVNSSEWTNWASLGHPAGSLLTKPDTSFPALSLCQDGNGLIHLFVAGKGVWEIVQGSELAKWSAWRSLGIPPGDAKAIWVGNGVENSIELFVRTANDRLFHKWQAAGQSWTSNYTGVDWPKTGNPGAMLVIKDHRRRMEVITSMGGSIFFKEQTANAGAFEKWEQIQSPNALILFDPFTIAAARNADGRLELITQSQLNRAWHAWQTPSPKDNLPEWTNNWGRYNANLGDTLYMKKLELGVGASGCLTVFAQYPPDSIGKTHVRYLSQDRPSGEWRGWRYFEDRGFGMECKGKLSLITGRYGEFHLFIRNQKNSILTATSSR